jgi:hypothetical protein
VEDQPEASHAGRFVTHLNVRGAAALEAAVLDCWRSCLSAPETGCDGNIAVLIHPLLGAECAGVCFTVDPVRLRPDLLLVVSTWGLGAGRQWNRPDRHSRRRSDLGIEDFSVVDKPRAIRPSTSGDGVEPVPTPDELRRVPCLPESWLQSVGQYGLAIEQVFEAPQDIEWAIASGKLWILQSRPMTALPDAVHEVTRFPLTWEDEEEPRHYWWLEHITDRPEWCCFPPSLTSPGSAPKAVRMRSHTGRLADTLEKYVHGRVYMAKADSPLKPGDRRIRSAAMRDLFQRLHAQNITQWEHWGPEIALATGRLGAFDAKNADGPALADHLEDTLAVAIRHWMIHTLGMRPIRSAALLEVYARLIGKPPEQIAADIPFLLAGAETVQTRLVESLYDLACLALPAPEVAQRIVIGYRPGSPLDASEMEPFVCAFERLMDVYGGRVCYLPVPGYPVDLPFPWREAPQHVWEMIAAYMPLARQGENANPRRSRQQAQQALERRVEALCANATDPALGGISPYVKLRPRARLAPTRAIHHRPAFLGQYFQALWHAGRWLTVQRFLDSLYDVFWLNTDEVLAPCADLQALLTKY